MSTQPHQEVGFVDAASAFPVSVEEYLRTSYRPDRELIDGELKEKPMPTRLHGFVQAMIALWFGLHMDEWEIAPETEVRTQVRSGNFRLPDVAVTPLDKIDSKTQNAPPIVVIEVLSDDDRYPELSQSARDFKVMGVQNVWLIDPERRVASVWNAEGAWEPVSQLWVLGTPIYLDLGWLWAHVDKRAARV